MYPGGASCYTKRMLRYYATVRPVAIYFNMLNATGNCTSLRRCACSCAVDPHPRAPSPPAQPPLPPALPLPETSSPLPEHGRSNLSSAALRGVVFAAAVGVGCLALLLLRLITWLLWGGCQRSKATITTRHVALHECGFASAAPQRPSSTSPDHVASTAPSSTSPGYLSQVELTPVDTLSISSDCSSSDASAPADAPPAGSRSFEIDSFAGARVDLERKIGEGGFAAVWLAVHEGAPIAVKILASTKRRALQREAAILRQLRHPCICSFFGVVDIHGRPAILLEYLAGGTLEQYLGLTAAHAHNAMDNTMDGTTMDKTATGWCEQSNCALMLPAAAEPDPSPEPSFVDPPRTTAAHSRPPERTRQLLRFAQQLASGLAFLHSHSVVHRDVKGSNVILDQAQQVAKISDFGISHAIVSKKAEADADEPGSDSAEPAPAYYASSVSMGTTRYLAPELFSLQSASGPRQKSLRQLTAADAYSFALLLFEMLHEQRAFAGRTPMAALILSSEQQRPPIDLPIDLAPYARVIEQCWSHDLRDRPSLEEVRAQLAEAQRAAGAGRNA